MLARPLISPRELADALAGPTPTRPSVLDIRWDLASGPRRDEYERGHIPGAPFVDLDAELAAPPGSRGRHPLPDPEPFAAAMRAAGVSRERPVVVYDGGVGHAAARAWWLLRDHDHGGVAVLDGGLPAWVAAGFALDSGGAAPAPEGDFDARPGKMPALDAVAAAGLAASGVLIDARAGGRFRGETEPVDSVAGHIPGAVNRPTAENVGPDGRFRRAAALRTGFAELGVREGVSVGAYCGSGVSAAHEILALELAGIRAALYPGSWSEWITDPARPIARGP